MKKLLFLFLSLHFYNNIHAQEFLASAQKKEGKCGYINPKGEWVIQPDFEEARFFSEGLAIVKSQGKYGYINKRGEFIIKPKFTYAQEFKDGLAIAGTEKGWGMIDTAGAVVLEPDYNFIDYFSDGFARVKDPGWAFVRKGGEVLKTVDFLRCESFSEGLARVEIKNKWGFIDTSGALVIKAEFTVAGNFTGGLAMAKLNDKAGFIDKKGNFIPMRRYDKAKDFYQGKARVYREVEECWSFVDTTGKVVLTLNKEIEFVSNFNEGFARVHILNGENYINEKGACIMDRRYEEAKDFRFGVAVVGGANRFLLIDTSGHPITKREFTYLDVCPNGLIRANCGGKCGFMDTKGNWVIPPEFIGVGMFVDVNKKKMRGDRSTSVPIKFDFNDYK